MALLLGCVASLGLTASEGPLVRLANTSLRVPQRPPTRGFKTENAFPGLAFAEPLSVVTAPGDINRLFICERGGRIMVITNLAAPKASVFLDLSRRVTHGSFNDPRGLLSVAFHPGFATNGWFYVFFTTEDAGVPQKRIARFTVQSGNPNAAQLFSEQVLIAQPSPSNAHKGGDLCFGPDGYLYVSLGDGSNGNDLNDQGQRINRDFFSAILRLDVDQRPGSLMPNPHPSVPSPARYAVPPDNPFVGAASFNGVALNPSQVRTEFWAVGLRNPWRLRFDAGSGMLLCGDVGESSREEINIVVRGGNYGWPFREGTLPGPKVANMPRGFSSLPPRVEYSRGFATNQGFSVTGGVVYRGSRLSQLTGRFVFADYVSGNLWAVPADEPSVTPELLANDPGIAGFALDPRNGDVLMADVSEGLIKRLVYNNTVSGEPLPATLADAGVFTNLSQLSPHAGIVPYDLNVPFWSDGAIKFRWFSIPDTNLAFSFSPDANWAFPTGAVWIKHFELVTNTTSLARKRIETRLLVKNSEGVHGFTYRWGALATNATLVEESGLDEDIVILDGGILRTQRWHYPGRSECLACHTEVAGGAIGFNSAQLNRDFSYPGGSTNQLAALSEAGYFDARITNRHALPALAGATDDTVSREFRVRSYLAANCSHCHRPGGGAGGWDARLTTPTALTGLIEGKLDNNGGNEAMRIIKPGSLDLSMLHQRLRGAGTGRMPPLATSELDQSAIQLISAWITNDLPSRVDFRAWQTNHFGGTNAMESGAFADPDLDAAVNYLEYLTGSSPHMPGDGWRAAIGWDGQNPLIRFMQPANRATEVQFTTNSSPPFEWHFLNVPENRPFFPSTNRAVVVPDSGHGRDPRYYRVGVREP